MPVRLVNCTRMPGTASPSRHDRLLGVTDFLMARPPCTPEPPSPTQATWFPLATLATDSANGLLAVGGDLSTPRLLAAYRQGIFPWFNPGEEIMWWTPNPRMVLFPESLHVSRRLRRQCRAYENFHCRVDNSFEQVVVGCATNRGRHGNTWLGDDMCNAYLRLRQAGCCHSYEAWNNDTLLGGIVVIQFGSYLAGETMFSAKPSGSTLALLGLCGLMSSWPRALLDCQVSSSHLLRLGARDISRVRFLQHLEFAATTPVASLAGHTGKEITIAPQDQREL